MSNEIDIQNETDTSKENHLAQPNNVDNNGASGSTTPKKLEKDTKDPEPVPLSITAATEGFGPNAESVLSLIRGKEKPIFENMALHQWGWFAGANLAILATFMILFDGSTRMYVYLLAASTLFPFIFLLVSKSFAIGAHHIHLIDPEKPRNDGEQRLFAIVKELAEKAGLPNPPEVGVYDSPDMNAFATGPSKFDSLIAFSTAILGKMDDQAIAAVAAHEVAHIANGDMVTMTLVQSVVNTVVYMITVPLWFLQFFVSDSALMKIGLWLFRVIIRSVLLFLGFMVSMAFSRHREFGADALAARLVSPDHMISALETLRKDNNTEIPQEQKEYACLKINGRIDFAEIFASHPAIERRIAALQTVAKQA